MDEVKKKNFILINSLGGGGAERQVSYISQLDSIEKILCIEPILQYDIPREKIIFLTNKVSNGKLLPKVFQIFTVLYKLKKIGINRHTHLICFLQLSTILGVLAKYLFGCKTTLSIRINPFLHAKNTEGFSLSGSFFQFLLHKADHIVPNSYDTANDIKKHFPEVKNKVHAIVNGYDIDFILKKSDELNEEYSQILNNYTCLLNIGRTDKQKGQWHIIRIFNQLLRSNPTLKLFILGEGEMYHDLVRLAETFEIKTYSYKRNDKISDEYSVFFTGFQKNPYYFYKHSALFLFPSIYEGLPNALIEALICRTPVISSDCKSGPKEIMLSENDLDIEITKEVETEFGYLMPKFSGEIDFSSNQLSQKESMWINAITKLIATKSNLEFVQSNCLRDRYSLKKLIANWKNTF